jgi:hypothetical protein
MMNNKRTVVIFIALLLFLPNVKSSARPVDNTTSLTGFFQLVNPCNGETVSGPIDVYIVVSTAETSNGTLRVNVHHNSHGTLNGNQGNEYQINRRAKGQFDEISSQYVITWIGEFIGTGAAPNFTAEGTLRVFVNAQNEPTGSQLVLPTTTICK